MKCTDGCDGTRYANLALIGGRAMTIPASQLFWPTGRTNRAPYWVLGFVVNAVFNVLDKAIANPAGIVALAILSAFPLAAFISICLVIGRLHDINRSGWWVLPIWLPVLALVFVTALPQWREYALASSPLRWKLAAILCFTWLAALLYVGLKRGTQGPNRFGADPLARPR